MLFATWKAGRPYLQTSAREPGRKNPRSICTCLGSFDEAPARLASLLPKCGVAREEIPAVTAGADEAVGGEMEPGGRGTTHICGADAAV